MHTTTTQRQASRKELIEAKWQQQHRILYPRMAWMLYYEEKKSIHKVCEKFGISRKTFYKWWSRFEASGFDPESLKDESRRPHRSPMSTPEEVVLRIVKAKAETGFGPRRLKSYLVRQHNILLSEHTIWKLLKRQYADDSFSLRDPTNNNGIHHPGPGDIVQVSAMDISEYMSREEFVQYTAIDLSTQLRISQIYHRHCSQTASDFLKFILEKFPFNVKEIQTPDDYVFMNGFPAHGAAFVLFGPFHAVLVRQGIKHTALNERAVKSSTASMVEKADCEEFFLSHAHKNAGEVLNAFRAYIDLFNNNRKNEKLNGLTPLQKLQSFPAFKDISYFTTDA